MENGVISKVITLQAGETVTLTAKDGSTIGEVKKPKRNAKKEREWEKEKYHRFTFLVDKQLGQQFIDILGDMRPLDWFKEQLKTIVEDNTLNVKGDTLKVEELLKCVRCGTVSDGYVDGYFKCENCEFGNYEPTDEDSTCDENCHTGSDSDSENDKPIKKKPAPPATDDEVKYWDEQNSVYGKSWKDLAKETGRHHKAIYNAVLKRRKKNKSML